MKIKVPKYLFGSWLLSLTLLLAFSISSFAQVQMTTDSQIEAQRTQQQISSQSGVVPGQTSNRPMAFPDPYCEVTGLSTVEPITRVLFADLDNSSDVNSTVSHEDFTGMTANVNADETYTFTLEGYTGGNYSNFIIVWVDWDQDGVFDETTERYEIGILEDSTGEDGIQISADIDVPADALGGETRMRVLKRFGSSPGSADSCAAATSWGQVEDYTVEVSAGGGGGSHAYCIPEGTNSGRYIDNFSTTGGTQDVSNMGSGYSPDGYGDFYDTHTLAQAHGEDVEFEVDVEGGSAGFRVWVDWNQDGVFDTTEEVAYQSDGYSTDHTGTITVPADALEGDTRMRIVNHWLSTSGDVDPCETGFNYGEFEDYKFTVEGAGGGGTDCEQDFAFSLDDGTGDLKTLLFADDFEIVADETMSVEKVTYRIFNNIGEATTIAFYEDDGGIPGGLVESFSNVAPDSQTIIGNNFGFDAYDVEFSLPTAVELDEGIYWVAVQVTEGTDGGTNYWVITDDGVHSPGHYTDDGGATWVQNSSSYDFSFKIEGQCEGGSGGGGLAGETCVDPLVVTDLPYDDAGNTGDYGNFYDGDDVPDLAPDAVTTGTGSEYYLSGNEVVYAYTPADDEVLNISTTNDDDWIGLWAFTGCPFDSTVGYHTSTSGDTRLIEELPVTEGETYYFVISTWSAPESTDYTIHIEKVGGTSPGDDGALFTDTAGDPGNFFNSFAGVTFDVENSGSEPLTLTGMRVPVTDGTLLDIDVYYTTTATTNVGVQEDPSEWTLLESHVGLPMLEAEAWDVETFTQVPLDNELTLEPGDSKGIYVIVTNYDSDGVTYHYTNGNFTASNDDMTIYSNGYGSRSTPFDNAFADRAFVGEVQYSLDGGGGGGSDCITTSFDSNNGGSAGWVQLFDVSVKGNDMSINSIDVNTSASSGPVNMEVYIIEGDSYVGNETNPSAWGTDPVATGSGTAMGTDNPSTIDLDAPLSLDANEDYAFAILLDQSPRYTNGTGSNQHYENDDLELNLGAAVAGFFDGTVFDNRIFNGTICYDIGGGGGGSSYDCEQDYYQAGVDPLDYPSGIGFSSGNIVANDVVIDPNSTFEPQTVTFDMILLAGDPTDFTMQMYQDNGSGGVGDEEGPEYAFTPADYTATLIGNWAGSYPLYSIEVDISSANIVLENSTNDAVYYWIGIGAELSSTGDFTYWNSYDYDNNPSNPTWQYTDDDGWFEYVGPSEGGMLVEGVCTSGGGGTGDDCDWTVIVEDTGFGDEVAWELRDDAGAILLSGGDYGLGYYDEQTVTAEGPLEFMITNEGVFGDNTPTYSVSNGTEVLVSGTLTSAETLIFSDLNCGSGGGGGGGFVCADQFNVSNAIENGSFFGGSTNQRMAVDIIVGEDGFTAYGSNLNVFLSAGQTTDDVIFDFIFYDDSSGLPGNEVHSSSGTVHSTEYVGENFGFDVYTFEVEFDDAADFDADSTYWMEVESNGEAWETSSVDIFGANLAFINDNTGGEWSVNSSGDGVYSLICEEFGGDPGSDCSLETTGTFEDGKSFTKNLDRVVAHDITVPADQNMLLEKINLNAFIGNFGAGVEAQDVDIYIYEDNGGQPGAVLETRFDVVPTSQTEIGEAFGYQLWDVELDFAAVSLDGAEGAETTYWIGASLEPVDGSNTFWEFYSGNPVGYGQAYNDGTGFVMEPDNEGVYTFHATCSDIGGGGDDCGQGDDSNGFENGYNITAGGTFRNADDFMVSADNTLNIRSIELNIFSDGPVDSIDINFFEDDGGMPGATVVESVSGLVPYAQPAIGAAFGYTVYAVYVEVDLNFDGGTSGTSYWMQPEAQSPTAFWEVTSEGTLGELIHTSEAMGPWTPDEDGVHHGVFKLHCDVADPPEPLCLFDITASVEPITRVVLSDIDNTSSAVVNGSPALEDFTSIEGAMSQGVAYDVALEGNTDGDWTNYFTVWIDWDQNGEWEADEMYEIGSITNSTGTDGQQATGTITVPADAPLGSTTMRVIKNFNTSPTDPCGQYSFGQGEDYTIVVDDDIGVDDQSSTAFSYYPNPTSGVVNITANKDISSVSVVNVLGQQVIAQSSLDNGQVDLSALSTGTYMFRVMFEDGSLETFKVLKE